MAQIERYKGYVILTLCFVALFGGYVLYDRQAQPAAMQIIIPTPSLPPTAAPLVVDVVGAVLAPGVYTLPASSRWEQAIETAGGLTARADRQRINMADRLVDGQQIYVPEIGTPIPPTPTPGAVSAKRAQNDGIGINSASSYELEQLPGIGPTLAERIVAYRQEHGAFERTADIMQVKGIGPACYAEIEAKIRID